MPRVRKGKKRFKFLKRRECFAPLVVITLWVYNTRYNKVKNCKPTLQYTLITSDTYICYMFNKNRIFNNELFLLLNTTLLY